MDLKLPPPIVGLITAIAMWLLHRYVNELSSSAAILKYVSVLFLLIGLIIELLSVFRFFRLKTTINPLKPERSKVLVTTGLFRYSRNPMYVGMCSVLIAIGFWFGNILAIFPLIAFIAYITTFQIKPEEKILLGIFGEDYVEYSQRVRRWL